MKEHYTVELVLSLKVKNIPAYRITNTDSGKWIIIHMPGDPEETIKKLRDGLTLADAQSN